MVELASPSESTSSSQSLPAKLMLNLVPLMLVSLQHITRPASSSDALESNEGYLTRSTEPVVNKHLFDAVVELLITVPEIIRDMLPLLVKILSGIKFLINFAVRIILKFALV